MRYTWVTIRAAVLSLAVSVSMTAPAFSDNSEIHVEQVAETLRIKPAHTTSPVFGNVAEVVQPAPQSLNLQSQSTIGVTKSLSIVEQLGLRNTAEVAVIGTRNFTLQRQQGALNESKIDINGSQNNILVDQSGLRLNSEINVADGAQKTILHIQRGRGDGRSGDSIDLSGTTAQRLIVVDTPLGRRVLER
ncbi:hypothetical protein MHM88_20685 [Epibacterium sp. MM17-32]|uniref:hypothetical protein n=1 Tax=Epibacterium sp. MM17-32 TaxID=2917734 RepID=UPI001EF3E806|nr:hypothetical protein [Epibacterium sp. MM17-32]MCG7630229.1 hypothetical protein [Epibacterium sp. MM17-32]